MSSEDCLPEIKKSCEMKEDVHLTDSHGNGVRKEYEKIVPGPKRATLAAQKFQHQRLTKPFRPPGVQKASENAGREKGSSIPVPATIDQTALQTSSFSEKMKERMKNRSAKAAAQFKPPLASWKAGAAVRPTPTIQALERKLQVLKRAVKVKENSEEEILCGLIEKWTEAGREIAWEVWGVVKDNIEMGRKREVESSWGWEEGGERKRQKTEVQTLGDMLRDMGISTEIYGWDDEEEEFK